MKPVLRFLFTFAGTSIVAMGCGRSDESAGSLSGSAEHQKLPALSKEVAGLKQTLAQIERRIQETEEERQESQHLLEEKIAALRGFGERETDKRIAHEPPPAASAVRAKAPLIVLDTVCDRTEQDKSSSKFTWKSRLKNDSDAAVKFSLKVDLTDTNGSVVRTDYKRDLRLAARDVQEFTGTVLVLAREDNNVSAASAEVERWTSEKP